MPYTPLGRRIVLKGFAAAAGSAVLAACGAEQAATNTPRTAPTMPASTSAATTGRAATNMAPAATTAQKVTIEYWGLAALPQQSYQDLARRFGETTPNITVNVKFYPTYQEIMQGVQAALAAKAPPAVANVGFNVLRYAVGNIPHLPVEEAAKRDPQGMMWLATNFLASNLELGKVDGVLHGMPYSVSNPILYCNMDVLGKAGLDRPPRMWNELRDYARRIVERTNVPAFNIADLTAVWAMQGLLESNGARVFTGSGKDARTGLDSPESIEAGQFYADLVLKDKTTVFDNKMGKQTFISGGTAMITDSIAQLTSIQQSVRFPLQTASFPTWDQKPRRVPAGGNNLFIFATDPAQQAAAWEFIKYLNAPEPLTAWIKATGYIPLRKGLAEDPNFLKPYYDENRLAKAATDQVSDVVPWVSWPGKNGLQADKELSDARDRLLTGQQDAATSFREGAKRINDLIKE